MSPSLRSKIATTLNITMVPPRSFTSTRSTTTVSPLDTTIERHPRIDLAAIREQFRPAADSREVRGDKNLIRPRLGQRDGGDWT